MTELFLLLYISIWGLALYLVYLSTRVENKLYKLEQDIAELKNMNSMS